MANELSTAGVIVSYAFEAVEGVRPLTGYQRIPNIKSTPDLNPEPSSLEVTDLSDTEWKRYILGLKDPGGALGFLANNTDEFQGAWRSLCYFAEEAAAGDLATWFCIDIPGLAKAFYFAAIPSTLGVVGMEVDAVAEVTAYVSPNAVHGWGDKPTKYAAYITSFIRKTLSVQDNQLEFDVAIEPAAAGISTVSATPAGVVTVTNPTVKSIKLVRVGPGKAIVTVTTNTGAAHTAGKTIFEVASI